MPRAWYIFVGEQTFDDYNNRFKYEFLDDGTGQNWEPSCNSSNNICAIYAIGVKVGNIQSFNPSNIIYPRSLFAAAQSQAASQPTTGGVNTQGRPYYVRVKPST